VALLEIPVRGAASALALSGLAAAAIMPWHPSIFDRPVADAVHQSGAWELIHVAALLAPPLALFGAAGIVAAHGPRMGRLGRVALLLSLLGTIGAGALAVEAVAFPVLADHAPELIALGGPLSLSWPLLVMGVLVGGWPLGLTLVGVAAVRAGVFPSAASLALAFGPLAFIALGGPFVPVAGILSGFLFGGAQLWWAYLLWRAARAPLAEAGPAPPPVAAPEAR
jgi:hypothetical protein